MDETEVNHRHRLLGFLLIPGLVLSSVLVGLNWEGEEIGCNGSGGNVEPDMISFEGDGEYQLYTFKHDDLNWRQMVRAGWLRVKRLEHSQGKKN